MRDCLTTYPPSPHPVRRWEDDSYGIVTSLRRVNQGLAGWKDGSVHSAWCWIVGTDAYAIPSFLYKT